jgi:hypothetical protein
MISRHEFDALAAEIVTAEGVSLDEAQATAALDIGTLDYYAMRYDALPREERLYPAAQPVDPACLGWLIQIKRLSDQAA